MSHYALIYESPYAKADGESLTIGGEGNKVTVVSVPETGKIIPWARTLAAQGVERIELCGGMSPVWRDKVAAAIGKAVPVSSVTFGFESLKLAAAYSAKFETGAATKEAFIIRLAGADAGRDRIIEAHAPQTTTLLPVPDADSAAAAAREMVAQGVELIELYGFDSTAASAVITAVDGAAPVGVGSFALEAFGPTG
ncbi:MAG: DUF6506 family protein [Parvibaculaceae bacterium]